MMASVENVSTVQDVDFAASFHLHNVERERPTKRMSETSSSAQRSTGAAGFAKQERLLLTLTAGGIVLALALAVASLRFLRLNELPAGISFDEGTDGIAALRVLQGEHAVFYPELGGGRETLGFYAMALSIFFLGRTPLAIHLPSALVSAGTVFVVFWLGRLLFERDESGRATPWRGLLVGGVGAGLLAVSIGQTIIGRTSFRGNYVPLFLCLSLALLWWGWPRPERKRERYGGAWRRIALAGACAGLLAYTYLPARFAPFLFLLFGLSFLFPYHVVVGQKDGGASLLSGFPAALSRVRTEWAWIATFAGVAALAAAPLFIYFILHPEHFFLRSGSLSVFQPDLGGGDQLRLFLDNVRLHLSVLGFHGDPNWLHNFAGRPMLNPWEAFFFWLGAGMAVWRWQRTPAYRLLLLWSGVMLLPAMLARGAAIPNTMRLIGATPAIYLLVAVGIWETFRFVRDRFFQENKTLAAFLVGTVVSGVILAQGVIAYRTYFQKWALESEVYRAHDVEWTNLARLLNAQAPGADTVYLIPNSRWHYGFDYLYQGAAPAHTFHTTAPDLAPKIESALTAMENLSAVKVVEWDANAAWIDGRTGLISDLLDKYGRFQDSEEYADFQIRTYTDVALGRPWTLYEQLEPLTVEYDGGIALQGFALGQGVEQLSSGRLLNLGENRSLWMALEWRVAPGLDIDYAISARLHNAEGGRVYQQDVALWNPDHASTVSGGAAEQFGSLVQLDIPAGLRPGEYELRLVVYDAETLKPTVELGVWEAETALTRLRLAEVQ